MADKFQTVNMVLSNEAITDIIKNHFRRTYLDIDGHETESIEFSIRDENWEEVQMDGHLEFKVRIKG